MFLGDLTKPAITIAGVNRFYWNLAVCLQLDTALLLQNFAKIQHCLPELWKCIQWFTFFPDTVCISTVCSTRRSPVCCSAIASQHVVVGAHIRTASVLRGRILWLLVTSIQLLQLQCRATPPAEWCCLVSLLGPVESWLVWRWPYCSDVL